MSEKEDQTDQAAELRRRAEALIRHQERRPQAPAPGTAALTLRELGLHQIELEMQNDELRRTQGELSAARARYFHLYDSAPVGYCTLSAQGLVLEANSTATYQFGELIQQPITRFIHPQDQDGYYLRHKAFLATGEPYACDLRMVRQGGVPCWMHLSAATAPGPDGEAMSRLVLTDITERKQAEEEQARLEARLQQAQYLETLGVLAGGVAHDFNNLLTGILGNANLGCLALEEARDAAPFFQAIEMAAMRAADLTRQLLAYAGNGQRLVTDVDLNGVVMEVAQVISAVIPPQVALHRDLADLPSVQADETQIFQVLLNLVTNACEAFAEGAAGRIEIRTRIEQVDQAAVGTGTWVLPPLPGDYATLEVEDSGSGMDPGVTARAFEPFFTTKFTGRGLGLAAVIGILRNHGGGLQVRSEPGRGSSFKLFLPAIA